MKSKEIKPEMFGKKPLHLHKGKNYLRYLVILLFIGLIILSIYTYQWIGLPMLFVALASLAGVLVIAFPRLYLFDDGILIEKKKFLINSVKENFINMLILILLSFLQEEQIGHI